MIHSFSPIMNYKQFRLWSSNLRTLSHFQNWFHPNNYPKLSKIDSILIINHFSKILEGCKDGGYIYDQNCGVQIESIAGSWNGFRIL